MDITELGKLKKLFAAMELKSNITNEGLYGWQLVLEPYSYEEVRDAVLEWARTSPYSPHPGEIARLIETKKPTTTAKPKQYAPAKSADEHYRYMAGVYARICGIDPPKPTEDPLEWFREARCKQRQ